MWGYENLEIEPDGFTLAKGLGGGHAIGALLVQKKANIFTPGDHASTFGGNPFACRAAITVLEEIKRRRILKNVFERGNQLNEGFNRIYISSKIKSNFFKSILISFLEIIKGGTNLTTFPPAGTNSKPLSKAFNVIVFASV